MLERATARAVKLLWTGGWDSTFRLLQLLLLYEKKVQPYYIIDPTVYQHLQKYAPCGI